MTSGEVLRFQFLHHESATLRKMNQLRMEDRFCDVTIVADQLRFPGHRVVLAACSPFLRDQFLLNPSKEVQVALSDGAEMVSRLLLSCYTGALDFPFKDVVNYLTTASYLQMDHVVEECRRALSRYVDPRIEIKEDGSMAEVRPGVWWPTVGCPAAPRDHAQDDAQEEAELKSESEENEEADDVYVIIDADSPEGEPSGSLPRPPRQPAYPGPPYDLSEATDDEEGCLLIGGDFPEDEDSSASEECGGKCPGRPGAPPNPNPSPRAPPTPYSQPIHCSECTQAFQHPEQLVAHMKVHKLFMCPRCGKVFSQRVNLARHVHVHTGIKPYLCTTCGKTFTQNRSLKDHMNLHSGARPHHCHYCNMSFAHKPALRRHLKEQHGKTTAENCKLAQLNLASSETGLL
ncbi:zinc finger and BTB domain-containing protein 12-like isoform X2 [Heterodontus francisci]|uniref:zinc finger and BTB domain-containing protein 12-like isoform X2 n=1 Tax=Heterodontus francisci TaxID=7792 RepID=UPI00355B9A04